MAGGGGGVGWGDIEATLERYLCTRCSLFIHYLLCIIYVLDPVRPVDPIRPVDPVRPVDPAHHLGWTG